MKRVFCNSILESIKSINQTLIESDVKRCISKPELKSMFKSLKQKSAELDELVKEFDKLYFEKVDRLDFLYLDKEKKNMKIFW